MKIGSIIQLEQYCDQTMQWAIPEDAPKGIVIAIETDEDSDGYDYNKSITVRWENGKVETLALRDENIEVVDVTPKCYLNLYLHDRAYGGSEEGGWWYDTYEPVDGDWINEPPQYGHFASPELAAAAYEAMQAWCEQENSKRRGPSSMASEGHFVAALEAWPAEFVPARRPHYC